MVRTEADTTAAATASASRRSRPPRLAPAERLGAIEQAAARLFAEQGYTATTMDQIASAAGLSKPMVYRHFESKRELYEKLLARRRDELAAAPLDEYVRRGGDMEASMPAMIDAWFAHVERHPDTARLLLSMPAGEPEVRPFHAELHDRQRSADIALIREQAPDLPDGELEPLAEVIHSSLCGLALWWLERPGVPREVPVAAMLRVTRALLGTLRDDGSGP